MSAETPTASHASPMTCQVAGRQFMVIGSGGDLFINGAEIDDYLVAYALPAR